MITPALLLESVGDVWALWIASTLLSAVAVYRAASRFTWRRLSRLIRHERGASYALPFVMTFPVYLLLICVMIQSTLILIVKMGTVYAAYAAARAGIVWRSAEPYAASNFGGQAVAEGKARFAARFAMTPFASSYERHYERLYGGAATPPADMARQYYSAYEKMAMLNRDAAAGAYTSRALMSADQLASEEYVTAKFNYAYRATSVNLDTAPNGWNRDVTAHVTYRMPLHVPGVGRVLSWGRVNGIFVRDITSTITLPSETPQSANQRLGIPYVSE